MHDNSLAPVGGDGQYQKGQPWDGDLLPIKETDSDLVRKIKIENEISKFIFDQIIKPNP